MNKPRFEFTPDRINRSVLFENQEILVFPSNTEGKHGMGLARLAYNHFGAIYGVPMGLQGRSYGIITKDLKQSDLYDSDYQTRMLYLIKKQAATLWCFAEFCPQFHFYIPLIGTGLAGLRPSAVRESIKVFRERPLPNIILPKEFA
ncbi:hypothetical protein GCM10028806_33530 [Spirosoma terrae]|uniref:Macro domain-containing protein n=1 Tax=Spirosoma terrae TaxID=1968276 RepID=A0A6L9LB42_9BACT|nr:hypothetical protein [Spirosoma terrae]NDU95668.1 hypothetical protein [Spirosoma terrae]